MSFGETDSSQDDKTVLVHRGDQVDYQQSNLELRISSKSGDESLVPCYRQVIRIGTSTDCDVILEESPTLVVGVIEGQLHFRNETPEWPTLAQGQVSEEGELKVGQHLDFSGHRLLFWDRQSPASFLQGCSSPYAGRIWPLSEGSHRIGRGSQQNIEIALQHPTVSRRQARLEVTQQRTVLHAESETAPVYLNGEKVDKDQSAELSDSNLLEFGSLIFRFFDRRQSLGAPKLSVQSLGSFSVRLGEKQLPTSTFASKIVKWLLARLAYNWQRPIDCDSLLETIWPDADPERSRHRLNTSLSQLRQILKQQCPGYPVEYVLRSSSTLQLNEEHLGSHDVLELEHLLSEAAKHKRASDLEGQRKNVLDAFLAYQGPFLEGCELDWASNVRSDLENRLLLEGRALLSTLAETQETQATIDVAHGILKFDSCCQQSYVSLMRAHRLLGNPAESLKIYNRSCKQLQKELGVEPDIHLLREFHEAKALL
jgi:DNA-binding SARP family transcriptional activator